LVVSVDPTYWMAGISPSAAAPAVAAGRPPLATCWMPCIFGEFRLSMELLMPQVPYCES